MGRRPNTAERRAQILGALLEELATVGYERASTKSIAARAGLTPGLLHYHFASKLDMLLALVDAMCAEADARCSLDDTGDDPHAVLKAYVESRVGLGPRADERQVRAWVALVAEAMGQPRVRERLAKWLGRDQARIAELLWAAGVPDPREHAALLLAMILGCFSMRALKVPGVPRGYAGPRIVAWLDALM